MKTIGIILLLIIVGGGVYFFVSSSEQNEAISDENTGVQITTDTRSLDEPIGDAPFAALVSFTDNGFEPKVTSINKGETVRFVNNSSTQVWPASAFHPTHKEYPETSSTDCAGSSFDTCRGLQAGEFWEFTFNESGSWKYHNHLNASQTGAIEVK